MTNNQQIIGTISVLLSLYFTAADTSEMRVAQFDLFWLPALKEFDAAVVTKACQEWQAGPNVARRPQPGQIAQLCAEIVNADRERQLLLTSRRRELPAENAKLWERDPPGSREAAMAVQQERYRKAEEWRQERTRAGQPITGPTEPPKRKTPQEYLDRYAARAEVKGQALQLDRTLAAADRYIEGDLEKVKRIPILDAAE